MREPEVFVLADRTLNGVVVEIEDDQWERRMPIAHGGDRALTLREFVGEYAREDAALPSILAGGAPDGPEGDLLGDNPYRAFTELVDRACSAALGVDDLDRVVHTSAGDLRARAFFWQANALRGLGAHDIAQAIGSDDELPDDLVRGLYEELIEHGDDLRAWGFLPPAVPAGSDAPLFDRLLALCGRAPALL